MNKFRLIPLLQSCAEQAFCQPNHSTEATLTRTQNDIICGPGQQEVYPTAECK